MNVECQFSESTLRPRRAAAGPAQTLGWWRPIWEPPAHPGCLLCHVGPGPPAGLLRGAALSPRGLLNVACPRYAGTSLVPCLLWALGFGLLFIVLCLFVHSCLCAPIFSFVSIHSFRTAQQLRGQAQSTQSWLRAPAPSWGSGDKLLNLMGMALLPGPSGG